MTENAYHKTYTLCATWMKHVFNQSTERNSLYFLAGKKFTLLWQVLDKGNVPFPLPLTTEPEVSMVIFHCPLPVAVDLCSSASAPSKWFSAVITHCTRRHIFGFWVFFVQSSNYYVNERMAMPCKYFSEVESDLFPTHLTRVLLHSEVLMHKPGSADPCAQKAVNLYGVKIISLFH